MNVSGRYIDSGRRLPQFRVTLNSRCGRSCFFCRPSGEAVPTLAGTDLPVDALIGIASIVRNLGVSSIKLTGGDPALYPPLEQAVLRLRQDAGFEEIELISRHPRIGPRAARLADNGVALLNMSIDTLDPVLHHELCGVNDLPGVLGALDDCLATGVPCKVNAVVMGDINDEQIPSLIAYCAERGVHTVKLLDVIKDLDSGAESFARRLAIKRGKHLRELYAPLGRLVDQLRTMAVNEETRQQGGLGHPMTVFTLASGLKVMLKDSTAGAWYGSLCHHCPFFPCHDALMALRLTADLRLQFCLLRDDVTVPLMGMKPAAVERAVQEALAVYETARFTTGADRPRPIPEVLIT